MAEGNGVTARIDARLVAILVAVVTVLIAIVGSLITVIYMNMNDKFNDKIKQNQDYYTEQTKEIREDQRNLAVDIASISAKLGDMKATVEVIKHTLNADLTGEDSRDGHKSRGLR